MYKNINVKFTAEQYKALKNLRGSSSWQDFFMNLVDNKDNNISTTEQISLEKIRQEIKEHIQEYIEAPTGKTYDHTDVVDDVKEHLLAHMQNKHIEHQNRHDEQEQQISALAQAIHKITNIMPSLNNDVPKATIHRIKNKTDILSLVESCAFKP